VITDNSPQFKAAEFHHFACDWELEHHTSSPYHSQSNVKAEATVKIAKNIVHKTRRNHDLWKSILDFRNTPTVDMSSSPAQRLNVTEDATFVTDVTEITSTKARGGSTRESETQKTESQVLLRQKCETTSRSRRRTTRANETKRGPGEKNGAMEPAKKVLESDRT
jgi:transposase InsO family protein